MSERFITSTLNRKDGSSDNLLRPALFADFPGQHDAKALLELMVRAAAGRNEPLEHILLSGPPGLGKTSLAYIIANEKECTLKSSSHIQTTILCEPTNSINAVSILSQKIDRCLHI